jgi:AbrB family looped-hinge helix DNA binding protein
MWIFRRWLRFGSIRDKPHSQASYLAYNVSQILKWLTLSGAPLFFAVHLPEEPMKNTVSRVTTKGQLVIPSKLRRKYGIRKGTRVAMIEEENRIILQPLTREYIRSLRGSLKGEPSALKFLKEGRSQDREL